MLPLYLPHSFASQFPLRPNSETYWNRHEPEHFWLSSVPYFFLNLCRCIRRLFFHNLSDVRNDVLHRRPGSRGIVIRIECVQFVNRISNRRIVQSILGGIRCRCGCRGKFWISSIEDVSFLRLFPSSREAETQDFHSEAHDFASWPFVFER